MSEVKKDLIKLEEGKPYIPGPDEFVITEKHSISDIIRFAISCADAEEVRGLLDLQELCNQQNCSRLAAYKFTWPGQDEAGICDQCVKKLEGIAGAMGLYIQIKPLEGE